MKLLPICGRTWYVDADAFIGVYRLDEGRCILVDSGQSFEREELAALLAREGLTPAGVLNTHVHTDHSINNRWLRERYGSLIAVPEGEAHLLGSAAALRGYLYCCSPGTLERQLGDMLCPADRLIPAEDGLFSFCGADFRVVHTPGHSEDHVCLITPDNVCCAGDAVLSPDDQSKLPYAYCVEQMLESTRRVEALDCAAFLLAHRGVCTQILPAARHTRGLFLSRAADIAALADAPVTMGELWERTARHFALHGEDPVEALKLERNFRCLLDYLVDTGALPLRARDGVALVGPEGEGGAL